MASFLDKIRQSKGENPLTNIKSEANNTTPSDDKKEVKTNPLLAALKSKKTNTETKEEKKINPFVKPKEEPKADTEKEIKKEVEEAPKAESTKTDEAPKNKPEKKIVVSTEDPKAKEEKVENKIEQKEKVESKEKSTEELKVEEIPKETVNESKDDIEEVKEKPAKTSKKKSPKKKAKKEEKAVDDIKSSEDTEKIEDFNEAVEAIRSNFEDPNWEKYTEEIKNDLNTIIIDADMTSTQLKTVMSDLTKLRDKVWLEYLNYKTEYELLAGDKPEGLIERTKKISFTAEDKNDFFRKKAGILACMNYEVERDGEKKIINLFEICDEYKKRFNFLHEVMKQISFKADALIKMSTGIKLENSTN